MSHDLLFSALAGGLTGRGLIRFLFPVVLVLPACSDTFDYEADEFRVFRDDPEVTITREEGERILLELKERIDNGEEIGGTLRGLLVLAGEQFVSEHPWAPALLSEADRMALDDKAAVYRRLMHHGLDSRGFVPGCDGLLFSSLLQASGYGVDLHQAEAPGRSGLWFRSATRDCFSTSRSPSTISRDMVLGLAMAFWQSADLKSVQSFNRYVEANSGVIGEAEDEQVQFGRAFMTPALTAIRHELDYRLGGDFHHLRAYIPEFDEPLTGFEAHLQVLRILLRGLMYGGLIEQDLDLLAKQVERQPRNGLFLALYHGFTDGDQSRAAAVLLDESLFPSGRLPTTADRCEPYLWQREMSRKNTGPCGDSPAILAPVDYLFVHALIRGTVRGAPAEEGQ